MKANFSQFAVVALIALSIAGAVFLSVTYTSDVQYAAQESQASDLIWGHDCSGEIYKYEQGYRCDGYSPEGAMIAAWVGVLSVIAITAIVLLKMATTRRARK